MRSWVTICLALCMVAIFTAGLLKFYFHLGQ